MNLEKLNLVELDAQEAVVTEGGHWYYFTWAVDAYNGIKHALTPTEGSLAYAHQGGA